MKCEFERKLASILNSKKKKSCGDMQQCANMQPLCAILSVGDSDKVESGTQG